MHNEYFEAKAVQLLHTVSGDRRQGDRKQFNQALVKGSNEGLKFAFGLFGIVAFAWAIVQVGA